MSGRLGEAPSMVGFKGAPRTLSGRYIRQRQLRHFLLYNLVPFLGTVLAIALIPWLPPGPIELALLVGMWALAMVGMSVGLHRYFGHRAFRTGPRMRAVLAVLGCMTAQGPLVSWVAVHRRHHERSDLEGDPHSPNLHGGGMRGLLRGLWHAHVAWLVNHEFPNPVYYATDIVGDRTLMKINAAYGWWIALGLALPTALGFLLNGTAGGALMGLLWGGLVRMFVVDNCILSINSFSHAFGGQVYDAGDNSRNNAWVALPTFGESWQNNHHGFQFSARIGLAWWQLDLGWLVIRGLERCGLVTDVRLPTPAMLQAKRLRPAATPAESL
jgi:stearoyl-CoA desaturase (Delta-9 desaturase)